MEEYRDEIYKVVSKYNKLTGEPYVTTEDTAMFRDGTFYRFELNEEEQLVMFSSNNEGDKLSEPQLVSDYLKEEK